MVAGNVYRKIRIEVYEFLLGDVAFGSDRDEVEEFLEYDVLCFVSQLELFEVGCVEFFACVRGMVLRAM